jgi:hypothetical protein
MMMAIQIKLMTVMCNMQNMMIQEFQLDMESKLIRYSNAKMQKIQFVSMMMAIQMKLMKVIRNSQNMMIQEFQHDME